MGKDESVLCVFRNYVYDLSALRSWHPAGAEVLESARNGEVEKYLFGVYAAEKAAGVNAHAHSGHAVSLLSAPIARLQIAPAFAGLAAENAASVAELRRVAADVYELHLKVAGPLQLAGYSEPRQLGRFYALTLDARTTRLFTAVNLLHWRNLQFLRPHLKDSSALQQYFEGRLCRFEAVPILFKHYRGGQLTAPLVEAASPELSLSEELGLGFQLDQLEAGEVFIIAGGTGIYPFLDLIDLVYKKHLITVKPHLANEILSLNPLLRSGLLERFAFTVYLAL